MVNTGYKIISKSTMNHCEGIREQKTQTGLMSFQFMTLIVGQLMDGVARTA